MSSLRLTPTRYLELLHTEGERLLVAAENIMDRRVPTCDGWTVDDVVFHVGGVYSHKVATLRLGRRPMEGEWEVPSDESTADDNLVWCHVMLHAIADELAQRSSDEASWTFWPPDQTVGFWQRRMANETAVHRADVESVSGSITPIDTDLAVDGIDEFTSIVMGGSGLESPEVSVEGGRVTVQFDEVTISGDPSDVLLWLWGRQPDDAVVAAGTAEQLAALRATLQAVGQ